MRTDEQCNGLDDDCDGATDETYTVVPTWGGCATAPRGGAVTLLGFTFDAEDAVRDAVIAEGGVEAAQVGTLSTPGGLVLDPARTLANLLLPPATAEARWVPFPAVGGDTAYEPNITRSALESSWSEAWAMRDGPGDDLVVLEHGNPIEEPEAFAISVRDARTGRWSPVRYEHFDEYSDPDRLFATAFDLADFGLAGGIADRVRIHNVFAGDAPEPDRVDDPSGEGFVVRAGDFDYAVSHPLTMTADGPPFPTALLDTDLLFVAALHPTVERRCCVAP